MAKEWAKGFYDSGAWKDVRQSVLKRDRYCCVRCGRAGNQVHHIVRLTPDTIHDERISLNPKNLETLCDDCHKAEHKNEREKKLGRDRPERHIELDYQFDDDGNLIPPGAN